ncbi:MAG: CcmD family protein [Deltaproteobacteria bacterium]|nr:MAG: CcmD family protein [Deltaproteobacteria bacterium]
MDTSQYLFFGYAIFWILPVAYMIYLSRKIPQIEKKIEEIEKPLA